MNLFDNIRIRLSGILVDWAVTLMPETNHYRFGVWMKESLVPMLLASEPWLGPIDTDRLMDRDYDPYQTKRLYPPPESVEGS
mgnify:CR=1 FL=1